MTQLFYGTYKEQCARYIRGIARSYIEPCLAKLGCESESTDSPTMVPLTLAVLKTLCMAPGPLDPVGGAALTNKYGFQYLILTGMMIFTVQIGRFQLLI
jgi:hypothetical protein